MRTRFLTLSVLTLFLLAGPTLAEARVYKSGLSLSATRGNPLSEATLKSDASNHAELQRLLREYRSGQGNPREQLAEMALIETHLGYEDAAEIKASHVLKEAPAHLIANLAMAQIQFKRSQRLEMPWPLKKATLLKEALKHINLALAVAAPMPQAYYWRGQIYEGLNDPAKARADYKAARELAPQHSDYTLALARLENDAGNAVEALRLAGAAIQNAPTLGSAHAEQALAHLHLNDVPQAIQAARLAIRFSPEAQRANYAMGRMLQQQKNTAGAVHHFHKAMQAAPQQNAARLALADLYESQGLFEEATGLYAEALSLAPEDDALKLKLSQTREALKNRGARPLTEAEAKASLERHPEDLTHLAALRRKQQAEGALPSSPELLAHLVSAEPVNDIQRLQQVEALFELGRYAEADAKLERLIERQAGHLPGLYAIAETLRLQANLSGAARVYRFILKSWPEDETARRGMVQLAEQDARARMHYENARFIAQQSRGEVGSAAILLQLQQALRENPRLEAAKTLMQRTQARMTTSR